MDGISEGVGSSVPGDPVPVDDDAVMTSHAPVDLVGVVPTTSTTPASSVCRADRTALATSGLTIVVTDQSPTPFGVFAVVLDGHLLSYRYLTQKELVKAAPKVRA